MYVEDITDEDRQERAVAAAQALANKDLAEYRCLRQVEKEREII